MSSTVMWPSKQNICSVIRCQVKSLSTGFSNILLSYLLQAGYISQSPAVTCSSVHAQDMVASCPLEFLSTVQFEIIDFLL